MTYTTNIREAITAYYGDRCPDHDPSCVTCVAWYQFDQLQARVEQAEKTLEFYADENRFGLPSEGPWGAGSVDFGRKARDTLAQKTGDLLTDAAHEAANHPMIDWRKRAERAEEALKYASMVVADVVETREVEPNTLMIARIKIEDVFPDFVDKTPPAQIHNKFTTQSEESGND